MVDDRFYASSSISLIISSTASATSPAFDKRCRGIYKLETGSVLVSAEFEAAAKRKEFSRSTCRVDITYRKRGRTGFIQKPCPPSNGRIDELRAIYAVTPDVMDQKFLVIFFSCHSQRVHGNATPRKITMLQTKNCNFPDWERQFEMHQGQEHRA